MKIIITGETLFSLVLAKKLKRKENEIILVVKDKEKALEISAESEVTVVNSNPAHIEDLEKLEMEKCDVFIAATEKDELNVLSAMYANSKGVKKIFVQLDNPDLEPMLKTMGVFPINPQEYAAGSVALDVLRPLVSELVGVDRGEFELVEKHVSNYKNLVGKKIGLMQGEFFVVLASHKDGSFKLSADYVIEEDSVIIVLYEKGKAKDLEKALKGF